MRVRVYYYNSQSRWTSRLYANVLTRFPPCRKSKFCPRARWHYSYRTFRFPFGKLTIGSLTRRSNFWAQTCRTWRPKVLRPEFRPKYNRNVWKKKQTIRTEYNHNNDVFIRARRTMRLVSIFPGKHRGEKLRQIQYRNITLYLLCSEFKVRRGIVAVF